MHQVLLILMRKLPSQSQLQQLPQLKPMGNSTAAAYGQNPTLQAKLIDSEPGVQIYQTPQGQQFEQYLVSAKNDQLDISYQFRITNQHPQLVDVFYAGQKPSMINCTSPASYEVVTERIPYRLAHLPPQQLDNAVTLLRSSLLGFKDLFKVNGLICVKDTMIGVSAKNKVKVWLNPIFAINDTQPKPMALRNLDPACHQREMVHNIFDLINSKAEANGTWRQLIHARQRRSLESFEDALTLVEEFIRQQKLSINDELKNPFNKALYAQRDENSEIDKLEDLKFNHKGAEPSGNGKEHSEAVSPTFQRLPNVAEVAERKNNQGFAQLKNKCINAGNAKVQQDSHSFVPSTHTHTKPQLKSPFGQIQKNMKLQASEQIGSDTNVLRIHQPTQVAREPLVITNRIITRQHPPHSPREIHSLPKKLAIKFHYLTQPPSNNPINLPRSPAPQTRESSPQPQQIIRSASQPKPYFARPPVQAAPTTIQRQNLNETTAVSIVKKQSGSAKKEDPISLSDIPASETINMMRDPESNKKQSRQEQKQQSLGELLAAQTSFKSQKEEQQNNQASDTLQAHRRPTDQPTGKKDVHEAPSYEIRVLENAGQASPRQDSSVLEYDRSPDGTPSPSPKRRITLELSPSEGDGLFQKEIFKEIARLAERPYQNTNQSHNRQQAKESEDSKQPGGGMLSSRQENSMRSSRQLKRSQGSPRNESGTGSSIMSRSKLPKVSYKEMRKMLLQTLQDY